MEAREDLRDDAIISCISCTFPIKRAGHEQRASVVPSLDTKIAQSSNHLYQMHAS